MKKHNDLIQTDVSKKKMNKIMIKFMMNIQEHELNWEKNIIRNKSNKNVEISDEDNQFRISSDEKKEKKEKWKRKIKFFVF